MPFNQRIHALHQPENALQPPLPPDPTGRFARFRATRKFELSLHGLLFLPSVGQQVYLELHPDGRYWPLFAYVADDQAEFADPAPVFQALTGLSLPPDRGFPPPGKYFQLDPTKPEPTFRWFGLDGYELEYRQNSRGTGDDQRALSLLAGVYRVPLTADEAALLVCSAVQEGHVLEAFTRDSLPTPHHLAFPVGLRCTEILTHYLSTERPLTAIQSCVDNPLCQSAPNQIAAA